MPSGDWLDTSQHTIDNTNWESWDSANAALRLWLDTVRAASIKDPPDYTRTLQVVTRVKTVLRLTQEFFQDIQDRVRRIMAEPADTVERAELRVQAIELLRQHAAQVPRNIQQEYKDIVFDLAWALYHAGMDKERSDWALWEKALIGVGSMINSVGEDAAKWSAGLRKVVTEDLPDIAKKGLDLIPIMIAGAGGILLLYILSKNRSGK